MGEKIKNVLNRMRAAIFSIIFICAVILTISNINHQIQLSKEAELFQPIGTEVEVNGHLMNVYTEGTGNITLVFLSGGGTCSPVLDFKSLYSQLSDTYRIAVVEKAGYGFSEITNSSRDIDTILDETRQALSLAGVKEPYVLCPHSMSGLEALYWARQYPEEVTAIVGLDMAVPETYETYKSSYSFLWLAATAAKLGITRWFPGLSESDAMRYGTLTEEEKELYRAIFYRRTSTKNMLNEVKQVKQNAQTVAAHGIPELPILMFASNGEGTGWKKEEWKAVQEKFAAACPDATLIELDCSHYVHDIEYEKIALEIKQYLSKLGWK